ncbi:MULTISPECIES: ArpU family phage packaging/lysis transcriptional regulator [Aerococcus]|nr:MULTISPECIES: ArpU family phage packaging/lysis transcriptional regulator [Aerococcus]MDL5183599.1 ArpU family phage packaging/lysis transcriptional regulator [Aerococcus mictus]KAA9299546.1 DUF1492 domain-containing protein [Aerococcus tenax]MDK6291418.1 ArpU family phage packaging/lysis transcriptional regulator [Aerococcus urinae]MDK6372427.1 ArpU family phage packaging/lysis transcriptional regulator [Aerococcus urinae]MDK6376110.1 ArpU family phage packaging/lysis transcriptional regul
MYYIPPVDEEKTAKKVNKLLSGYDRLRRLSGYQGRLVANYRYTPEKHVKNAGNYSEDLIEIREEAKAKVLEIENAIDLVEPELGKILEKKYIKHFKNTEIYIEYCYSESTFYRLLRKAQIQFAEAFKGGELLCFENENDRITWN